MYFESNDNQSIDKWFLGIVNFIEPLQYVLLYFKAAVRRKPITANAAEMEVEGTIKRWLQLAADRKGGHKRRLLQKTIV